MQQFKLLLLINALWIGNIVYAQSIGDVFEQSGTPGEIVRNSGEQITAELNAPIVSMDKVETENGRLKIQFIDDTQVSLTEHTVVEINEYVYDPNPSKSKMALNFASGTARFATGRLGLVAKENIAIQTPTASIGIRGTDFTMSVDELGRSLVILLPDENCTDSVELEEGCAPSGSITVTNQGGTVLLEEAFQAVMVSTFETAPTTPVTLVNIDLNTIDNMFIVQPPAQIEQAMEEQADKQEGIDFLEFNDLDIDFLEQDLLADSSEDLEFSELDVDRLDINFLGDLLSALDTSIDMDPLNSDKLAVRTGPDKITGTANPGYDSTTLYNTIIEDGQGILFLRIVDGKGKISLTIPAGSNARIQTDAEPQQSVICVNDCSDINIFIKQGNG